MKEEEREGKERGRVGVGKKQGRGKEELKVI